MRDPYQTLGLPSSASPADAEVAFRRLLKECHPDRYVGAPSAVVADAERRTREVTAAISAIRSGWRPPAPRTSWDPGAYERATADPGTDWFGNPLHEPQGTFACPLCGTDAADLFALEVHFAERHAGISARPSRRPGNRFAHWLRFLPAPSFSLFLALVLWWTAVVRLAPQAVERVGIWIGVVGFFVLRAMAYHAQRHRL